MSIHEFARLPDGTAISEIRLANAAGATASVLTFGAALRDLVVPMPDGSRRRVVLGFDSLDAYRDNPRFLGVTVGRHASRIDGGRIVLDGTNYQLALNEAGVHLHGGPTGFSRRPWTILDHGADFVTLGLVSPDGEDGYPGRLDVKLTYRLKEPATFAVSIEATTDAPTIVSMAHHSYWTLLPGSSIRDHFLKFHATNYTPFGADMNPAGTIEPVEGTPWDFRDPRRIGDPRFGADFAYDCSFVVDRDRPGMVPAAQLEAPDRSLALEVATTEPCIIFYDGAGLTPDRPDIDGSQHFPHAGLCLEPMRFPDNPNQPNFPSARLDPGETYRQESEYRFSAL
jgi:aldose 1-epimerase